MRNDHYKLLDSDDNEQDDLIMSPNQNHKTNNSFQSRLQSNIKRKPTLKLIAQIELTISLLFPFLRLFIKPKHIKGIITKSQQRTLYHYLIIGLLLALLAIHFLIENFSDRLLVETICLVFLLAHIMNYNNENKADMDKAIL